MNDTYSNARKKPTKFNSLSDATAWNQARTEERRAQRKLLREADPEIEEIRRIRREITEREQAKKSAEEAEAAKHALVGWPAGLSAHIDRGSAKTKASFVRYLARAVADYEMDFPDQAPAPLVDLHQEGIDRRNAESRARARSLETCTSKAELERLLALRPTDIGHEEAIARNAARHKLRQMAADPPEGENPMGGENAVEVQDNPAPAPALEMIDPEPVKRGRGRPPKFLKQVEITEDGAILED